MSINVERTINNKSSKVMASELYQRLSGCSQFFAHHSSKNYFDWLLLTSNVLTQSIIDQSLVIPTTCRIYFTTKPI